MRIKDMPASSQPREKLMKGGPASLADAELLAIILLKGTREENVVDMCNRLLARHSLENLSSLSLGELQQIRGIGPAKAMQIGAIFELSRRSKIKKKDTITCAEDVYDLYHSRLREEIKERFMVLALDVRNGIAFEETVSIGILDMALVHPREIFRTAIKNSASKIILVHNHPSGEVKPSEEDMRITEKLCEAGKILDIRVLDHIIIGDGYYSFRERGNLA